MDDPPEEGKPEGPTSDDFSDAMYDSALGASEPSLSPEERSLNPETAPEIPRSRPPKLYQLGGNPGLSHETVEALPVHKFSIDDYDEFTPPPGTPVSSTERQPPGHRKGTEEPTSENSVAAETPEQRRERAFRPMVADSSNNKKLRRVGRLGSEGEGVTLEDARGSTGGR